MVKDKDGRPQRGPSGGALPFCICGSGTLLDFLGMSTSMEHEVLSFLIPYFFSTCVLYIVFVLGILCIRDTLFVLGIL